MDPVMLYYDSFVEMPLYNFVKRHFYEENIKKNERIDLKKVHVRQKK